MQINVERKPNAQNVLTEIYHGVALVDRLLQTFSRSSVLVSQIDEGRCHPSGVATANQMFQDLMRIFLHQNTIVERVRFTFVGVKVQ